MLEDFGVREVECQANRSSERRARGIDFGRKLDFGGIDAGGTDERQNRRQKGTSLQSPTYQSFGWFD